MNSKLGSFASWRSPVLFVHGDNDRNVPFQQTTDLVEKLRAQNVAFGAIGVLSAPTSRSARFGQRTIRDIRVISGSLKNAPAKFTIFFGGAIGIRTYRATAESFDRRLAGSDRRQ